MASCNSEYTPKPKAYFKIDFPASHQYQVFDQIGYPYKFEYPTYSFINRDSTMTDLDADNPYSINVDVPMFNARIYLSYKSIGGKSVYKVKSGNGYKDSLGLNTFENLRNEAYVMANKHSIKAKSIQDSIFQTPSGASGVFFFIGGNAATATQFYVTDTSHHFLRGSLYFNAAPNEDSLSPVIQFLNEDIKHLVNTLQWKDPKSGR
ncbi:MAG: hypothetical protein C5B52_13010 [Bacteroidetes bacterium]|nr:MAG: hypothetical protein C5B52_13010 [Bacteroidota bacterium]